ncbi:hypothetical protein E4U30_005236 [Claviceps sp. LM220 group G6]|nr:hypothetical protein E4U15_000709 [Claviceps sp. LM218 group G6]KAG6092582.1 hypothetical protein E4U30_005236 [Claviceps sp. LM220 group G6]KAG6107989.1 hypothetical protein E4U31_007968 [Claviceps sp. LM219 group G6]KAG6117880.1 hypothetical protein E4U14_007431 [Claviceps sp. LM454 group G7]
MAVDWDNVRQLVNTHLDELSPELFLINQSLHAQPELAYQEVHAHDTLSNYIETRGYPVERKAYGLDTSFQGATAGTDGRLVIVCAEYDALPNLGHGCGHNLIATASLGAFLGAAHVLSQLGLSGRLRILGTPAEEGGGGKARLLRAGAFGQPGDVAASIMAHPVPGGNIGRVSGLAALDLIASLKFRVEFRGVSAHAAGEPWKGRNALDAAVGAYNNVSMLRQQMRPEERVHGVFEVGGTVPNVIPDYTRMNWYVRAPTTEQGEALQTRVCACIDAAAVAAGCTNTYIVAETYKHVISNPTLCALYAQDMAAFGQTVIIKSPKPLTASTDMGNVSHEMPGFHGAFAIPTGAETSLHSIEFAAAAATPEAHLCALQSAKGMAMLALRVLLEDTVAGDVRRAFEEKRRV